MAVINDSGAKGRVVGLCIHTGENKDITSVRTKSVKVTFEGFEGDTHSGLTRESCVRVKKQYQVGTIIRNTRQVSIVSEEELSLIANRLGIPTIKPEWLGANLSLSGISNFTQIPPASRLLFDGGVALVVDVENEPCQYPAGIIEQYHPGVGKLFVKNAMQVRGVTAWVEREGTIESGNEVALHTPKQKIWNA